MADVPPIAPSRDQRIMQWMNARDAATLAVAQERELRLALIADLFPLPTEGANTLELGNDWELKLDYKFNYALNNKEREGFLTQRALQRMAALGAESSVKAQRLVKWSPELSVSEYRKLNTAELACLSEGAIPALKITPSTLPPLTIKPPPGWKP